jgi:hypothetical protein
MHRLLYISTARSPLSEAEITRLLQGARRRNAAAGVTGLLVVGGRRFLQALEGPYAAVMDIFNRIEADPRHFAVVKLSDGPIERRAFAGWSMGYHRGGDAADDASLADQVAAIMAPISDETLRAYFAGFAQRHG